MATRGVSRTVTYIAWDKVNDSAKTGDAANHVLRWVKDGTPVVPTNSPSEVDGTNAPGVYKITLTSSETDCNIGILAGKSSTSNVSIMPVTVQFERLPDAAPGSNGGLPTVDANNRIAGIQGTKNRLDDLNDITASAVWSATTRTLTAFGFNVTVGSNLDKTGYTLTSAYDRAKTALANTEYTAPDNASLAAVKAKTDKLQFNASNEVLASASVTVDTGAIASAVWSNASRTLTAFGFTVALTSDYDRAKTALAASEYVAPDNTSIAAIKAKTDKLTFDASNYVYAAVAGVDVDEAAIAAALWDSNMTAHNTPGTAGAKINLIESRTANITSGTPVTIVQPVAQDQSLTLIRGDDYSIADGRALQWTGSFPSLTGATVRLTVSSKRNYQPIFQSTCTATPGSGGTWTVTAELTSAQTALLNPSDTSYVYDVEAEIGTRHVTLASGRVRVLPDANRT